MVRKTYAPTSTQREQQLLRYWSLVTDEGCYARRIAWEVCPPSNKKERQNKKFEAQMSRKLRARSTPVYAIFDYKGQDQ